MAQMQQAAWVSTRFKVRAFGVEAEDLNIPVVVFA